MRKLKSKEFLGVTKETYFDSKFLDQVTEDLFTLDAMLSGTVTKYNNIFPHQYKEQEVGIGMVS